MTTRLALDTAGDRLAVAAEHEGRVAERTLDGARRHVAGLLPLAGEALAEVGRVPSDVREVVVADGPGSFTGLRVAAAAAKAIAVATGATVRRVPGLMARAWAAAGGTGDAAATLDALRGERYAAAYRFGAARVIELCAPGVWPGAALPAVVADAAVRADDAPPDARALLALARVGAGELVTDLDAWEPVYGRPAEAVRRWEEAHGRPLALPPGHAG